VSRNTLNNKTSQTTTDMLKKLRLHGMSNRYEEQQQNHEFKAKSFEERFSDLLDHENLDKETRKLGSIVKQANFIDPNARIEDIRYLKERQLNKDLIHSLASGEYIHLHKNIIITGASGSGKTFLANALGIAAAKQLIPVCYVRFPELIESITASKINGTYQKVINRYRRIPLLIIDEWLLYNVSQEDSQNMFEAMHSRYNTASTILASQYRVEGWI
jgi:DNA replication protein DnaC